MEIGLYRDLAVGADRFGSEVWASPDRYALTLSVGAPPDPLGPQGQNWGFPPFNPVTLQTQDFAAFRDLVVANMRHAGAIRIDHAFQLQRLFLVPPGRHGRAWRLCRISRWKRCSRSCDLRASAIAAW